MTSLEQRAEIDRFKTDIDLVDFVTRYGYRKYPPKCDASRVAMIRGDEAEQDVLLIKRNTSTNHFIYIRPHQPDRTGTILDFLYDEHGSSMRERCALLRQELGSSPRQLPPDKELEHRIAKTSSTALAADLKFFFQLPPLSDKSYLLSRGLSLSTLEASAFQGKIGTEIVQHGQHRFSNTVFPIENLEGIIGLERKNEGFKQAAPGSDKAGGLWISKRPTPGNCKRIVITESPIDALSYHQLSHTKSNDLSTVYVATNGTLTRGQLTLLQQLIDLLKPSYVTCGFDNDLAGARFACNVIGNLEGPRAYVEMPVNPDSVLTSARTLPVSTQSELKVYTGIAREHDKLGNAFSEFILGYPEPKHGPVLMQRLEQWFERINLNRYEQQSSSREREFTTQVIDIGKHFAVAHVQYPHSLLHLGLMAEFIQQLRPILHNEITLKAEQHQPFFFQIERPSLKDWNEDLQQTVKQHPQHEQQKSKGHQQQL